MHGFVAVEIMKVNSDWAGRTVEKISWSNFPLGLSAIWQHSLSGAEGLASSSPE